MGGEVASGTASFRLGCSRLWPEFDAGLDRRFSEGRTTRRGAPSSAPGGAKLLGESSLSLGAVGLGALEERETGEDNEIVGEGGASNNPLRSLGVADANVMSGTHCPCRVLGCS